MLLSTLELQLRSMPAYRHHALKELYLDGNTRLYHVWLDVGNGKEALHTYRLNCQNTPSGVEVISYAEVV